MKSTTSTQYDELKAFMGFAAGRFLRLDRVPPEHHPMAVLEALERTSLRNAAKGLRMAVNDCVEMSSDWSPDKVAALDAELRSLGLLSLSEVRVRYWRTYASVLKRGRVRNEVEYYAVQGILVDQALPLAAGEREKLQAIVSAYEESAP